MASESLTKSNISLKGSTEIVAEFFEFGIFNILYQRGVFPAESFKREKRYGLSLWQSTDTKLTNYMASFLAQVKVWLNRKQVTQLVLVIGEVQSGDVLERWAFDINNEGCGGDKENASKLLPTGKDEKKVRNEVADVMRQITASVTFLPLLETQCSFDVLIYTKDGGDIPTQWSESGECQIQNAQTVPFRSFSTGHHNVEGKVTYRQDDD